MVKVIYNHKIVYELFVLDKNTWNYITVFKFLFDRNTW